MLVIFPTNFSFTTFSFQSFIKKRRQLSKFLVYTGLHIHNLNQPEKLQIAVTVEST